MGEVTFGEKISGLEVQPTGHVIIFFRYSRNGENFNVKLILFDF